MASQHRAKYAEFAKKSAAAQHQEAIMPVAGIDLHATYLVVTIVSNEGSVLQKPRRIRNSEADGLVELLEAHKPVEVVVEASGMWPWLFDRLDGPDTPVVLAHPKRLRAIADSNYKTDAIDAELLARLRLVDLIPEVFPKPPQQREQATLVRHRARLVRDRTAVLGRIHAELHSIGFTLPRGRLHGIGFKARRRPDGGFESLMTVPAFERLWVSAAGPRSLPCQHDALTVELLRAEPRLGLPMWILSAGEPWWGFPAAEEAWPRTHEEMAAVSPHRRVVTVAGADHDIPGTHPDTVVEAILEALSTISAANG